MAAACAAATGGGPPRALGGSRLPREAEALIRAHLGAPARSDWRSEALLDEMRHQRGRWVRAAGLAARAFPGPAMKELEDLLGLPAP